MTNISKTVEIKKGNAWSVTAHTEHVETVYTSYARDLQAKYLHKCTYIKKVVRKPLYNGFDKVIFYHNNGVRVTYIVHT